jgi:hypothetical protein
MARSAVSSIRGGSISRGASLASRPVVDSNASSGGIHDAQNSVCFAFSSLFFCFSASSSAQNATEPSAPANASAARSSYGKLPLSFEANTGQTDARVKFLSRGNGYTLFLTKHEATIALRKSLRPMGHLCQLSRRHVMAQQA